MRALLAALATVIPWIPAAPPPTPHPPLAPACSATALQVVSLEAQGATGSLAGWVVLRNVGAPCSLLGPPQLSFDAPQTVVSKAGAPGPSTNGIPPRFSLRAIPGRGRIGFTFWWSNWCGPAPDEMHVSLPGGGGQVEVAERGAPRCDSPNDPSTISASRFVQAPPPPAPSTHLPLAVRFVPSDGYEVVAGSVLHYKVQLRNTGHRPFRFGKCPAYIESLAETTTINELHVLNCRPAGVIAAGAVRVFAMEMRVPLRAAGKRWALFFELGPDTYEPESAPPGTEPFVYVD